MPNNNALSKDSLLSSDTCTYRIVSTLGSGGFGITYLVEAQMMQDGRVHSFYYAMKEHFMSSCCERANGSCEMVYSRPVATTVENSLKDFIAEAKRLQIVGARHNNIVKVKEIFQQNNTAYYVMEYLQGDSLRKYVESRGHLSEEETLRLTEPVIDAIGYLHANKMTHLDVKPDNIMLTPSPDGSQRPVLIDFGLSKHYDESNRPTSTINTMACSDGYSPIEQYGGISTFSPTADIYALGATMAFCLTGKAPTKSTDIDISEVNAYAGRYGRLGVAISKMMQPARTSRPQSIKEVYDLLKALTSPLVPTTLTPPTPPTPVVPISPTPPPVPTTLTPPTPPTPVVPISPTPPPDTKKKGKKKKWLIAVGCVALALGAGGYALSYDGSKRSYDRYNDADIKEYYTVDSTAASAEDILCVPPCNAAPVMVALEWNAYENLDLYVVQPDGNTAHWQNTEFNGYHSGDSTARSDIRAEVVGFYAPEEGWYDVFAYSRHDLSNETEAIVEVINGSSYNATKVTLKPKKSDSGTYYKVAEFYVSGSTSADSTVGEDAKTEPNNSYEEEASTENIAETQTGVELPNDGIPVTYADDANGSFGTLVSSYAEGNVSTDYDASAVRRVNNKTSTSSLRVALLWDSTNDLDLIVNQPNGLYLWYSRESDSDTGGYFGGDDSGGSGSCEYAKWTNPEDGIFDIFVRVRGTVPSQGIVVRLVVSEGNSHKFYTTRILKSDTDNRDVRLCRYSYPGSSSSGSNSGGSTTSGIPTTYGTSASQSYSSGNTISSYIEANTMLSYDATAVNKAARIGNSGSCKVTLLWNFAADCDLIVNTYYGTDVYYGHTTDSRTGAHHSGDVRSGGSGEAVTFSSPQPGVYDFFVRVPSAVSHGLVQLVVTRNGSSKVYSTYITKSTDDAQDFRILQDHWQ